MLNPNYLQWGYLEDKYFPKWGFIKAEPAFETHPAASPHLEEADSSSSSLILICFSFCVSLPFAGGYGPPPPGRGAPPPPPPFTSYIVSTPPGGFPPPQGFPQGYGTPPPFSKWPPGAGAHPAPNSAFPHCLLDLDPPCVSPIFNSFS